MKLAKRGRPSVRPRPTTQTTVRVDLKIRKSLAREFGSLSNALYFLYEGLQDFRISKSLTTERKEDPEDDPGNLTMREMVLILETLNHYLDKPPLPDGRRLPGFRKLAAKLYKRVEGPIKNRRVKPKEHF